MKEYIIYEQPVAENIRNFLKCEYLFEKFNSALLQEDLWGVKSSISTLLEMSDFIMRINLKVELLKDLEKCMLYFNNLTKNNDVDAIVLDDFISKDSLPAEGLDIVTVIPPTVVEALIVLTDSTVPRVKSTPRNLAVAYKSVIVLVSSTIVVTDPKGVEPTSFKSRV